MHAFIGTMLVCLLLITGALFNEGANKNCDSAAACVCIGILFFALSMWALWIF